ncbi:hemagglutinin repeat-containing protein [Pseudoduganella plicata]|uniref:Filamentous hemagglutinin N-terminal domain-containing protein n=1 Tax=Pseudoduganella plicata TaxID=321984 RepID=A0ABX5SBP4_9BURK|nr:hemagglutinin repeat-containing protein [Pseudoduganella plicata]QBQ36695.1 filamentous hemagglutinin N-terminal domain-containing protein [Pseudoduganella plicata]
MNKLRYRIVFNKTRGMCMAVQETARSQGKGQGQSGALATCAPAALTMPALRRLLLLLGAAFGSLALTGTAFGQVVADGRAPGHQRPTVLNAANGVLQVNVQTPSAAGVSRNVYSQFDVPKTGVILNNSRTDVQSQLGGWVQANPWMTDGTARVILNEVNSANPSRLQGYIEVAGQRAETIVANPAGISVDGGGFINVSRATLTTGTPVLQDGQLKGYTVARGAIAIDGGGLDASKTDYTALIARSVQVNAGLWAQRLDVIAGVNDVLDSGSAQVTQARQGAADAPQYAIDVARLGGMYANQIYLVGTEAGVGVRNAGEIGAPAGDLVVTASGRLENSGSLAAQRVQVGADAVANSGKLQATGDVALTAGSLTNSGQLMAGNNAVLTVRGDADNGGGTIAAGRIELTSGGTLRNAQGTIEQSGSTVLAVDAGRVVNGGGTLGREAVAPTVSEVTVTPGGGTVAPVAATDTAVVVDTAAPAPAPAPTAPVATPAVPAPPVQQPGILKAQLVDNSAGTIVAGGGVSVSTGALDNRGGKAYLEALAVNGTSFDNGQGTLTVRRDFTARTDTFGNDAGKLLVGGTLDASTGAFANRTGLLQAGRFTIDVTDGLDNDGGTLRQTGAAAASLDVGGELRQAKGTLDVAAALDLRAGTIAGDASTVNVTGDLTLKSGAASAASGIWTVGGAARMQTGDFDNTKGSVSAGGQLTWSAGTLANAGGKIASAADASIASSGSVDNTGGTIQGAQRLALQAAGALNNRVGTIETLAGADTLTVEAARIDNSAGRIANAGKGAASITAGTVTNSGLIGGNGSVDVTASLLSNAGTGRITSAGDMTMNVRTQLDNDGAIASGARFTTQQDKALLNNHGSIVSQGEMTIANAAVVNDGTIATATDTLAGLTMTTGRLDNSGGTIRADGTGDFNVRGDTRNVGGSISADGMLTLRTGGMLDNTAGSIEAGARLAVQAQDIGNNAGRIVSTAVGESTVAAVNHIDNRGVIASNGSLTVNAATLANAEGAEIVAADHMNLGVHKQLDNAGAISSAGTLASNEAGATLVNTGTIDAGGNASLNLDRVVNDGGAIDTLNGGALTLDANALSNQAGHIMASGAADVTVTGDIDNTKGVIQTATALKMDAGGALTNRDGVIESIAPTGTLAVHAGSIDNTAGRIVNAGTGAAQVGATGHIVNTGVIAGNGTLDVAARTMDNSGTVSTASALGLAVSQTLNNTGTISAATGLHGDQANLSLHNRGVIVSGGPLTMTAKLIDNDAGRIATAQGSHADMLLSAQNLSNQGGAIMADRNAAFIVADSLTNRLGLIQAQGTLTMHAGGMVDNTQGNIETTTPASTLQVQGGAVLNDAGRIVNAGGGDTAVRATAHLMNSGLIAGNGALALEAQTAVNTAAGTIAAGDTLALQVHGSLENAGAISSKAAMTMDEAATALTNRGTIVAGADATLIAGAIDNDGGQIAVAKDSGASVTVRGASLTNRNGSIVAERELAIAVDGLLDNSRGIAQGVTGVTVAAGGLLTNDAGSIEAAGAQATLAVQAGDLANGSGRIVNVGQGAATVGAVGTLSNSGLIAGNGTLGINAATLVNEAAGTIASAGAMTATIGTAMDNRGTIDSGAALDVAAAGASVRNSGLVVAGGELTVHSADFNNDDGRMATAKGSGAGIGIDATAVSNRAGTILSDAAVRLDSGDKVDNTKGTLQATGSLALTAAGQVSNDAGVIEALDPAGTLALQAGALDNGAGRIVNVGTGQTTLNVAGTLSSRGLIAGNGQLDMSATDIVNASGGTMAAGAAMNVTARQSINNAGTISSHDALTVAAATASVRNSGQIVSGGNAALDTGMFDNSGGQLVTVKDRGGAIALNSAGIVNVGGAIVADGAATITAAGALDNSRGTIEVTDAAGTLTVQAHDIDNTAGRLVNAGKGDTQITAVASVTNSGTLAGNGAVALDAATVRNLAGGTLAAGNTMDLRIAQQLANAGTISAGAALTMDQAAATIANSGKIVAGGTILLHGATVDNDGGQIATQSGADIAIASESTLSNRGGAIGAAGDATLSSQGAFDNSGGQVQTPGDLTVTAGGALTNTNGALEAVGAASTLAVQAQSIGNTTGRIVNAGTGLTTIDSASAIVNSGTIAGNGAMDITALTLRNGTGGAIAAGGALDLLVSQQLDNSGGTITSGGTLRFNQAGATFANSGRIGAGSAVDITAASITNSGQLYTVSSSGAAITLDANSLANAGGTVAADGRLAVDVAGTIGNNGGTLHGGRDVTVSAGGALANGSGTIESASGTLTVTAQSIDSSGRIVNGGTGLTNVTSYTSIVNGGTIAGNGALDLHAQTLRNQGQLQAGGSMLLDVRQQLVNSGTVSSAGTLIFNQAGASFSNSGQIAAGGNATFRAASFNNDGGKISTVRGSGAGIDVTAPGMSNRGGTIVADGKAELTLNGAADNSGGTLQAGSGLQLDATGTLTNGGGVIETLGAAATLTVDAASIDNGNGRINNAGTGDTKLVSKAGIASTGSIATMGNLLLSAQTLQNGAGGTIAANRNLDLAITQQLTNGGKISSGGTLTFDQSAATFTNSGQIVAAGNAIITAQQVNNNGGQLGTAAGSGADLALNSQQLNNQGGRIATDRDLVVTTHTVGGMGELFGGRDLALTMDGDYVQSAGAQQFHSNRDLSLAVTGNITNTSTFEAAGTLTLSGQQIVNQAGASIEGQGVVLKAAGDLTNAGEINGVTKLDITAANVRNTSGIVGGDVTLATQNLDNTGAAALIGATKSMNLGVAGTLNNTGQATLYSSGELTIGGAGGGSTAVVNNNSSTIEAGRDLTLRATTLTNVRENVQLTKVQTVDETVEMHLPSWYHQGKNPKNFDANSSNYQPHEVYFVNPADILEEEQYVTPDGYSIYRAVIRTHANDSVFLVAPSAYAQGYGTQQRITASEGTRVIYYTDRGQVANPDQGGASSNAIVYASTVHTWKDSISFSNQYGNCSSNCIRLITQPDYTDPRTTILRDKVWAVAPQEGKLEVSRTAHHTAVEDQIAPGSGPVSQIVSGGNMHVTVSNVIDNRYGDIMARGALTIDGGAVITNTGATLYRAHTFDGTWRTGDGTVVNYQQPSINEKIGTAAGTIQGGQGVSISARSFSNIDVTAGTVGNVRESVNVIGSGASGAASAGAHASAGSGANGGVAGSASGSGTRSNANLSGAFGAIAAAADLTARHEAEASGLRNVTVVGGSTSGSGSASKLGTAAQAASSGTVNGAAANGAVNGSGEVNGGALLGIVGSTDNRTALGDVRTAAGNAAGQNASAVRGAAIGNVMQVSPGGLFIRNPDAGGSYLYEARPQFANQGQWTSSDYLLNQLAMDPAVTQKRLGDGFYEQRLVREQLSELTGRQPANGASDDTVYKELLTNAVSAAREFGLRPGIALSADQVARLTSDIVWMESQTVQLPDGSTETVLVPKVYVAHVDGKALRPGGALVTGENVSIKTTEGIANFGGVIDGGNGRTMLVAERNIVNQGGTIAGGDVQLDAGGDIRNETLVVKQTYDFGPNSGSYTSLSNVASITATGKLDIFAGRDLSDLAGKITAGSASIMTGRDVAFSTVQTGSTYQSQISGFTQNDSAINHQVSQLSTGGNLTVQAFGNLNLTGTQVSIGTSGTGTGLLEAKGAINIAAVTDEVKTSLFNDPKSKQYDRQVHQNQTVVGAGVASAGNLTLSAGLGGKADLNLTASTIAGGGAVTLSSTNDVNIKSAIEDHVSDTASHRESSSTFKKSSSTSTDYSAAGLVVGSDVSGKNVTVKAANDIAIAGSGLTAEEALTLNAGRDLLVTTVASEGSEKHTHEEKKSGFSFGAGGMGYSKSQQKQASDGDTVTQVGSMLSGGSVTATSGRDTLIQGSTVVADENISIAATRDLSIVSAQNTSDDTSSSSSKKSGMIGTTFQPAVGSVKTTQDGTHSSVTQVGSQIASLGGNVTLSAGEKYTQTASEVLAPKGNIAITAQDVAINAALDSGTSTDHSTFSKTAIGGSVNIPLVSALQGLKSTVDSAKDTGDGRMKALAAIAAASGAVEAVNSAQSIMSGSTAGIKVSVSLGSNKSENKTEQKFETSVGSSVSAGGNVSITATGAGANSNLTAIGSEINGGGDITLKADNDVALLAGRNTASQHSSNKSSGSSIGIGFAFGGQQSGFTLDVGVSKARGKADGEDVTYTNTHVNAGGELKVVSGGDTTLKGAVISADKVQANVGGDLAIESLQDKSTFDSKQTSAGMNLSLCIPPFCYGVSTVGGNFSKAKAEGDYLSVVEQSGIKAGNGGFQLTVGGNTDLKGGTISSTQQAVDTGKNSLNTGSLTFSDLVNNDSFKASGITMSGSIGTKLGDQSKAKSVADKGAASSKTGIGNNAGFASTDGSQDSLTKAGISGGAITLTSGVTPALTELDRTVTSDKDTSGALAKDWNGDELLKEVQAGAAITSKALPVLAQQFGDLASAREKTLRKEGNDAEADKWKEGGIYRVAGHMAIGALGGGIDGALGAGSAAAMAPILDEIQGELRAGLLGAGVSGETASEISKVLAAGAAAVVGGVAGNGAGASTAFNEDRFNRQLHPAELKWITENGKTFAKKLSDELGRSVTELEALAWLTRAGEGSVDKVYQDSYANGLGPATSEARWAYNLAKQFILVNSKGGTFETPDGTKGMFVAKGGEFQNPTIYSEFRNDKNYRDYAWTVLGDNLRPDKPTAEELAVYNAREKERLLREGKNLLISALPTALEGGLVGVLRPPKVRPGEALTTTDRPDVIPPKSNVQENAADHLATSPKGGEALAGESTKPIPLPTPGPKNSYWLNIQSSILIPTTVLSVL